MRIALCLEYPLAYQGGVSVLCRSLAGGLSLHYDIVLVSPDSSEEFTRLKQSIPFLDHVAWEPATVSRGQSRRLAASLIERGVELAHFHYGGNFGWGTRIPGQSPVPFLARAGIKVFSTVHLVVGPLDGYCGPQKPLLFKLALWPMACLGKLSVLRHLQAEVVVSDYGADRLRGWYWPMRRRFRTIYHSRVSDAGGPPGPTAREKMVLYAGHLAERKGQLVLAAAFARIAPQHPQWKLILLGDGDPVVEARLRNLATDFKLEDRILLPGARDAAEWMRRAEVYVQPSYFEGLPLALQEAMLAGCACVATDIPGNNELIHDGENGLLAKKGDVQDLAAKLEQLLTDESSRLRFQQRARPSVLRLGMSLERMIQAHLELYES